MRLGVALLVVLLAGGTVRAEPGGDCEASPKRVAECFTMHGRLSAWNGNPTFRIHPSGKNRIVGVESPSGRPEHPLPPSLEALVMPDAFQVDLEGDFLVCPFTPDRPGRMRLACIADASNIKVRHHT